MAGGVFSGLVAARAYSAFAAIAGVGIAYALRRTRSLLATTIGIVGGIFVIGALVAVAAGGAHAFGNLTSDVSQALKETRVVRPPINITPGFAALLAWLMGGVGFVTAWVAIVLRRPALAMVVPLPVAAITAFSVPHDTQIASGLILFGFFAAGLGVLSSDRQGATGPTLGYELRRAVRALPIAAVAIAVLAVASRSGLLFPGSLINPALQAQKPQTTPLSTAPDRDLFDVQSEVTGPWVLGVLDVYDGTDWRLPPFGDAALQEISSSGIVDHTLTPGLKATITIRGLTGAVIPDLPNTVGVVATGPRLYYDSRSSNIRLKEGQINNGFTYSIAAAALPDVVALEQDSTPPPDSLTRFADAPAPPPAAVALIAEAPKTSKWAEWDWLRRWVLNNVTADGLGSPVSIPPSRVQQLLITKDASPFELVATETLFARWVGIPARIGYGFDGGTTVGDHVEIHPLDAAAFPEVYFADHGWLPVIGVPAKTKVSDSSDPRLQQFDPGVLPSDNVGVTIFRPVELPGPSTWLTDLRNAALLVIALLALALAVWLAIPPMRKARRRYRSHAAARRAGPRARIACAYCEWRNDLTDYGYRFETDTPLMLLQRFGRDEEHTQLAWLVTRALWGDLRSSDSPDLATDAEELARALRRRLIDGHPITVRAVAITSRQSLRHPYEIEVAPPPAPPASVSPPSLDPEHELVSV